MPRNGLRQTNTCADALCSQHTLARHQDEVNARYAALTKREAELEAEVATRQLTDAAVDDILSFARDVRRWLENTSWQDKRRTLELLQVKLSVKDGQYSARCLLGEWSEKVLERGGLELVTITNTTRSWSSSAR